MANTLPCLRSYTAQSMLLACDAGGYSPRLGVSLLKEYLDLAEEWSTPLRMIRGHTFSLIGMFAVIHSSLGIFVRPTCAHAARGPVRSREAVYPLGNARNLTLSSGRFNPNLRHIQP